MDTWKIFLWVYSPLSPGFGGLAVRDGLDLQPVKGNGFHKMKCSPKVGQKLCGKAILNSVLDRT